MIYEKIVRCLEKFSIHNRILVLLTPSIDDKFNSWFESKKSSKEQKSYDSLPDGLSIQDIANKMKMSRSALYYHLEKLEKLGLIKKKKISHGYIGKGSPTIISLSKISPEKMHAQLKKEIERKYGL